jgi:hypothetical protein
MSPGAFAVTEAHTDPLWPSRGAQTRLPAQSLSLMHAWSDPWLPTTTLLQMALTVASIDAEMDEGLPP